MSGGRREDRTIAGAGPGLVTIVLISFAATWLTTTAGGPRTDDDRPLAEQGFIGMNLRDIPGGHVVVSWIFPGPLGGEGLTSARLSRPDLIVTVDGRAVSADEFRDHVRARRPGETLVLEYRRARRHGGAIPDSLDHEETVRTLEVTLGSRDRWIGTVGRPRGHDAQVAWSEPPLLDPYDPENVLGAVIERGELADPLSTLLEVFTDRLDRDEDYHGLSRVRAVFEHPMRLPELARLVADDAAGVPGAAVANARRLALRQLDLEDRRSAPPPPESPDGPSDPSIVETASRLLARAAEDVVRAFAGLDRPHEQLIQSSLELLRVPRRGFYIGGPAAGRHIDAIRASTRVDFAALADGWSTLLSVTELNVEPESRRDPMPRMPDWLEGVVEGPIIAARRNIGGEIVVMGSLAANRYDMSRLAGVIDPGGDDEYTWRGVRTGNLFVVDDAGDDCYVGGPDVGPAAALFGLCIVDDRGGDDIYEGQLLAAGAAMYGFSLLLDRAGNDTYVGGEWSIGAACYGAGLVVDLGSGGDVYRGAFLCQGVGGPRGFGAVVDEGGRDLYRANGPDPSAYGTPAVYQSFSQGVGFGFRHYAAGGVGLIADLGGDDRYEAGEFAQGGAYFHGLGVLYDAAGRDLYYGNRYGQGFGVHQAGGALLDDAGDDTYWSMTAASQGAAWDIGVGLLLDRAGDDVYRCDGLGQGGAAMQAIALLVDLAGDDRYSASAGATQGESGADTYHFHETGAHSFSLLLDRGGGADLYSRKRPNAAVTLTGVANDDDPRQSSLHGVVIDE